MCSLMFTVGSKIESYFQDRACSVCSFLQYDLTHGAVVRTIGEYVGEDPPYLPGKVLYLACSVNADCGPGTFPTRERLRETKATLYVNPRMRRNSLINWQKERVSE